MKILDIVTKVGGGLLSAFVPGAAPIVAAVNAFLPEDKRLDDNSTGTDLGNAIKLLPADKQAEILSKEFDVEIVEIQESNQTLRAAINADVDNPHTTRPHIAKWSFWLLFIVTLSIVGIYGYAVIAKQTEMVKEIVTGWPFIASVIAPFVTLLWAYFGILAKEQKNKLAAASGNPIISLGSALMSKVMK